MRQPVYNRTWLDYNSAEERIAFHTAELRGFESKIRAILPDDTSLKLEDHLESCTPLFIFIRV